MMSCDFRPLMLTTKPTPHESCSLRGSYSPGPIGDPIIAPTSPPCRRYGFPARCPERVTNSQGNPRIAALQRPASVTLTSRPWACAAATTSVGRLGDQVERPLLPRPPWPARRFGELAADVRP